MKKNEIKKLEEIRDDLREILLNVSQFNSLCKNFSLKFTKKDFDYISNLSKEISKIIKVKGEDSSLRCYINTLAIEADLTFNNYIPFTEKSKDILQEIHNDIRAIRLFLD